MITIQLIKHAVEKNFCQSKKGIGAIPVNYEMEGDISAGNACYLFLLEKYRFSDLEIDREMDLDKLHMNRVRKYMKNAILSENERFINKLTLAENYIKINQSHYGR